MVSLQGVQHLPRKSIGYLHYLASVFKKSFLAGLAIVPAGSHAAPTSALPDVPAAWRAAAQADIEAAVHITRANHPGARDPDNPGFLRHLDQARHHGLSLAARVGDLAGYVAAVQGFNTRIQDGHAGLTVRIDKSALPKRRWPGFVTVWRGDGLYVYQAEPGQPAVGSKLLACDGRSPEQLIRENVFGFQGRVAEAGQWWAHARDLFVDTRNPFIQLPHRCRFALHGEATEHVLEWRDIDAQAERWFADSRDGETRPVGMIEPRKNLYWVSMPTFHPDEAERAAYRSINRDIAQHRARYLGADAIVVDLRSNGGGSSSWAEDFAKALWGENRVRQALAAFMAKTQVWWRASPANTDYVFWVAEQLAKQGQEDDAVWARTQAEGMRAALRRGEPFHVELPENDAGDAAADDGPAFTRPLYVVVPGDCASACLDAVDVFTRFPNTILIGAPSSADSPYMEMRREDLASGLAAVRVPNKMYVNRGRGNGKVYYPDIPVTELVWSVDSLLKVVERDLARR